MLNFKQWFEASIFDFGFDFQPKIDDALNVFLEPIKRNIDISPASIIDAELTASHVPFIYLQEDDNIYEGFGNDFHHDIVMAHRDDFRLSSKLNDAYAQAFGKNKGIPSAVGRIGYRVDFDNIRDRLPKENLKLLFQGKEPDNISPEMQKINDRQLSIRLFGPTPLPVKKIFNSIDIISIYSLNCTIGIAARAVQLLEEKDSINDLNKTIVIYDKKPYLASDFVSRAKKQEPITPVEPPKPSAKIPTEKTPIYSREYKPQNWRQALRQIGFEPTMGDSVIHKGKKYHG